MTLTITDFIEQVDGVTVEDISEKNRERINDSLADVTGGEGGEGAGPVNDDAILVSKNLDGRAGFTSIQDAIDGDNPQNGASGAGEGDTIFVEAGDYDESVIVDTKGLTITGTTDPSAGTATVTGQSTAAVDVRASGVTIDRLEVRNPGTQGAADPGSPGGAVGVRVDSGSQNVTVRDNIITEIGTADDDANPIGVLASDGTVGITVSGNEISNLEGTDEDQAQVQGVLINESGTQITGATVENNTITDLLDTRSTNAIRFNGDVSGDIVGNTISELNTEGDIPGTNAPGGFTQVIALQEGGGSTTGPSNVTVENNDISNIETTTPGNFAPPVHLIVGSSASVSSVQNNSFSADSPDVEIFVQDNSGGLSLNGVANGNTFSPSAQVSGSEIFPGDLTLVSGGGDALQTAIDNAIPGDRLAVDSSTYNPVMVDTSVSIQSVFARPTIDASGSNPGIAIEAVDTLVSGFEITGDNSTVAGISIRTSEGARQDITLRNNVISGITGAGGGGGVGVSFGILSFGTNKLQNLTVENNVVEDVGQAGVPGFGMQLEEIDGASILDNIVKNMKGTVSDDDGNMITNYGIGIQPLDDNSVSADFSADATVSDNIIENAKVGIVRGDTTDPSSSQISNNTFKSVSENTKTLSSGGSGGT